MTIQSLSSLTLRPESLPLRPIQPATAQPFLQDKAIHVKALWLCAFFPDLALEAAACTVSHAAPFAITEEIGGRRLVYLPSASAKAAGVACGTPLTQAYALFPGLKTQPRDVAAEMERLHRLAAWAVRFTPTVSLQPSQALLLEISASLRFFGGLAKLKKEFSDGLSALGAFAYIAITPTPSASLLLASQGQLPVLTSPESLRSVLSRLPISVLPLDANSVRRLLNTGVRDLHDLLRLPREGLARRYGPELLSFLDRALGTLPDPRQTFHAQPCFTAELELPWETESTATLLEAARCLFAKLGRFLRARDGAVNRLQITLHHAQFPPSRLWIGTRQATRDEEHLLRLLEEHLNRLKPSAPALKLGLATAAIQPFTASSQGLFAGCGRSNPTSISPFKKGDREGHKHKSKESDLDWQQLLEQLQARLGRKAVFGLKASADHRPEQAWACAEPGQIVPASNNRRRPLWLLPDPKPLISRQGHPWRHGPLSITKRPERIESGWWDSREVRRDYYVAKDNDGSRLWIFRNLCGERAWYLHGFFA